MRPFTEIDVVECVRHKDVVEFGQVACGIISEKRRLSICTHSVLFYRKDDSEMTTLR